MGQRYFLFGLILSAQMISPHTLMEKRSTWATLSESWNMRDLFFFHPVTCIIADKIGFISETGANRALNIFHIFNLMVFLLHRICYHSY